MSGSLYLVRTTGMLLAPVDDEDCSVVRRLGAGEIAFFSMKRPRSVPMHRMYFGMCREIGKNQDPERSEWSIDQELRVRAGHFEVIFVDGKEVRMPDRIAFDKLTHDQWMALWPRLEVAIIERFGETYILEWCSNG
jgi:hypothetical protein